MDDVRAIAPAFEQLRNHLRWILEVAVHVHDRVATRRRQSSENTFGDTEPARHVEELHARVPLPFRQQHRHGVIGRGVVDADNFVINPIERGVHLVQQGRDIPCLVVERYEHCEGAARLGRCPIARTRERC